MGAINMYGQFSPGAKRQTLATAFVIPPGDMAGKPKRIAHNTFRYKTNTGHTVTRLHETDIHREFPDGRQQLDTRGFRTNTTKDRLNRYTKGYSIYSGKGSWIVRRQDTGETIPFYDGIMLPDAFDDPNIKRQAANADNETKALKRKLKKFLKLLDKGVPTPNQGDCWCCLMFEASDPSKGASGPEHLLNHIEEGYMHGSLIVNALTWAGYKREQLPHMFHYPDIVKRVLRRYLKRRLGLT